MQLNKTSIQLNISCTGKLKLNIILAAYGPQILKFFLNSILDKTKMLKFQKELRLYIKLR